MKKSEEHLHIPLTVFVGDSDSEDHDEAFELHLEENPIDGSGRYNVGSASSLSSSSSVSSSVSSAASSAVTLVKKRSLRYIRQVNAIVWLYLIFTLIAIGCAGVAVIFPLLCTMGLWGSLISLLGFLGASIFLGTVPIMTAIMTCCTKLKERLKPVVITIGLAYMAAGLLWMMLGGYYWLDWWQMAYLGPSPGTPGSCAK
jgi:hypothetical protein